MEELMGPQRRMGAVLLAAGSSRRMGVHKLLLPLGGRPIIARTLEAALASEARPILVVLGHEAEAVEAALPTGSYTVVRNEAFASGMASSIRAGLAGLPPSVAGAVILLGDQPLIGPDTINAIVAAAGREPRCIVAPTYGGRRGQPVYFPAGLFAEFAAVAGDEGGRSVLSRHADAVREIELGAARDQDADTPEAYRALVREWEHAYGSRG